MTFDERGVRHRVVPVRRSQPLPSEKATGREFFIDNLLVRIHLIIVMIRWTGLAPWESEFPFVWAGGVQAIKSILRGKLTFNDRVLLLCEAS